KEKNKLGNKHILTLIDFELSSTVKRMWIINLEEKRLLMHTLVAHGKNTGEEFANSFSNTPHSNQSSLGFYITGKTYYGKHGLSLRLHGMEQGFNDKAEDRAIVLHGADYVSSDFIKKNGRLGRSQGCPAVPMDSYQTIIQLIADKTCMFIYHPQPNYNKESKLQDFSLAAKHILKLPQVATVADVIPAEL
ncbi:MAG TPA: murein L,D-transpeptidase catalytic domain family protein, partial [Cyclobacteriaceae bacterium]|nr:murein L,D-transpeptidase catalytic domain family protein [Cyclobacteriaceae bacterium]